MCVRIFFASAHSKNLLGSQTDLREDLLEKNDYQNHFTFVSSNCT